MPPGVTRKLGVSKGGQNETRVAPVKEPFCGLPHFHESRSETDSSSCLTRSSSVSFKKIIRALPAASWIFATLNRLPSNRMSIRLPTFAPVKLWSLFAASGSTLRKSAKYERSLPGGLPLFSRSWSERWICESPT